ncbi:hypothetical protein BBF96_06535 [Anoxybacter fermentans]|uniref:DUF3795 domain-containing protein n=1 Tax=Anoxybacter fermentans TaxID=1323375 RepID=A0A3Q9HSM9_9FIRM|nr:hypothetical protein BBF96_06535 [Anoxybacter fermentans]
MVGYCGLLCNECPVFIATINNDHEARVELAKKYSNEKCQFEPEDIYCVGCHEIDVENSKMCSACKIRACGVKKEVENCGWCNEYPCDLISEYVPEDSKERKRLDKIKSNLS